MRPCRGVPKSRTRRPGQAYVIALVVAMTLSSLSAGCGPRTTPPSPPALTALPAAGPSPEMQASSPAPGETRTRPTDGMATVYVRGGTFLLGSTGPQVEEAIALCRAHYSTCNRWYYERELPQHPVTLAGFWIDQTEVTNAQYRRCAEAGACQAPATCTKGTPTYDEPGKADHPAVCVSWQDAQAYCRWAGARLPTEAEWEYSFRGEAGRIFPWGDEFDGTRLNYCDANCQAAHADARYDDGFALTSPVGSHPQGVSWCGALGMGGNVSEWVADWLGAHGAEAQIDPTGPPEGSQKLVKGGSWFSHPTYCRGAVRASVDPGTRFNYFGFRCASR